MADFIRPEVKETFLRWREVIFGGVLMALGGMWMARGSQLLPAIGALLAVLGIVLIIMGWRRVRFPTGKGGPGVIEVDERQITYLGGHGGAAVSIDSLVRVTVETGANSLVWVLTAADGETLRIPGNATGSEALFDALVALPGVNYDEAQRAAQSTGLQGTGDPGVPATLRPHGDTFLIWQKDKRLLH